MHDGRQIIGENVTLNPQSTCPRIHGEGYHKCYAVCSQLGHAEDVALRQMRLAGYQPGDVQSIRVFGHSKPCDSCRAMLDQLGLLAVTEFNPTPWAFRMNAADYESVSAAYHLRDPSSHSRYAHVAAHEDQTSRTERVPDAKGTT